VPGLSDNPGRTLLFLKTGADRERGKDHVPVNGNAESVSAVRSYAAVGAARQMPVANRAMMTMIVTCMAPCAATAMK
jgi:hypothetical protein